MIRLFPRTHIATLLRTTSLHSTTTHLIHQPYPSPPPLSKVQSNPKTTTSFTITATPQPINIANQWKKRKHNPNLTSFFQNHQQKHNFTTTTSVEDPLKNTNLKTITAQQIHHQLQHIYDTQGHIATQKFITEGLLTNTTTTTHFLWHMRHLCKTSEEMRNVIQILLQHKLSITEDILTTLIYQLLAERTNATSQIRQSKLKEAQHILDHDFDLYNLSHFKKKYKSISYFTKHRPPSIQTNHYQKQNQRTKEIYDETTEMYLPKEIIPDKIFEHNQQIGKHNDDIARRNRFGKLYNPDHDSSIQLMKQLKEKLNNDGKEKTLQYFLTQMNHSTSVNTIHCGWAMKELCNTSNEILKIMETMQNNFNRTDIPMNEIILNLLIHQYLLEGNVEEAQHVINADFAKYNLTPNAKTMALMPNNSKLKSIGTLNDLKLMLNDYGAKYTFNYLKFLIQENAVDLPNVEWGMKKVCRDSLDGRDLIKCIVLYNNLDITVSLLNMLMYQYITGKSVYKGAWNGKSTVVGYFLFHPFSFQTCFIAIASFSLLFET